MANSVNFAGTFYADLYYFEGNFMNKLKVRGQRRARMQEMLRDIIRQENDDATPVTKSAKMPKFVLFDPNITGMSAAKDLIKARLQTALAKQ
jgi:hypothetical protein